MDHAVGLVGIGDGSAVAQEASIGSEGALAPQDWNILLVEDQLLIAMDAEASLMVQGVAHVITAASVKEAKKKLEQHTPNVAVLDAISVRRCPSRWHRR